MGELNQLNAMGVSRRQFGTAFEDIHAALMAALPKEEAPPGRLKIEQVRRDAMKAAEAGLVIDLDDLTWAEPSPAPSCPYRRRQRNLDGGHERQAYAQVAVRSRPCDMGFAIRAGNYRTGWASGNFQLPSRISGRGR
jgi:hypothetical protein